MQKNDQIPLSLYIHTPWCIRKCPYCDFNSHAQKGELAEEGYIKTLIQEVQQKLSLVQDRPIISIFIGGGTPSLLKAESYAALFNQLHKYLSIDKQTEITLEANPGTVEQSRFIGYRQAGINRISLGIQSFQNEKLQTLGRVHNAEEAIKAVETAKKVDFDNFNLDLMFGLPQQNIDDALYDLQTAINLQPTHISWYQLTLEPNTYFHRFPPTLPNDDTIWEMQQQGSPLLANNNFHQYEISAYSQANKQCVHNRNYWEFGDYLGIGAGAHSKITNLKTKEITRHWNMKNPKDYLDVNKNFIANKKLLNQSELPLEFMLNALRLQKNIPIETFEQRTFLVFEDIKKKLRKAQNEGLIDFNTKQIYLTPLGKRFLNNVLEFL